MTPDAQTLAPLAENAAAFLKALSHPARLMICCKLRDREMSVSEIEQVLDIRQPRLSRELAKLRDEGLVDTRRQSKAIFYRLNDDRVAPLIDTLCKIYGVAGGPAPQVLPTPTERPTTQRPPRSAAYGVFAKTSAPHSEGDKK